MASNFLEELIAEWYEYRGYFVRRNVNVGPREKGGYECELDVVAFHPEARHLVHIEPSMDADSWAVRERRFRKKFEAGQKYIPELFRGLRLPKRIQQVALLGFGSNVNHTHVGGGEVVPVREVLAEIFAELQDRPIPSAAVPEDKPVLRAIQYVVQHSELLFEVLDRPRGRAAQD